MLLRRPAKEHFQKELCPGPHSPPLPEFPSSTTRTRSALARVARCCCRTSTCERGESDDFTQAGNLFRLLPAEEQQNLFNNMAGSLSQTFAEIQARMLGHLEKADPAYAAGVRSAIAAKRAS